MQTVLMVLLAFSNSRYAAANGSQDCIKPPFKVAVDVGHGPRRFGATSARGGREYDFNLRFAQELVALAKGNPMVAAFLISPDDPEPSLKERASLANAAGPDLFLSIHHDSAQTVLMQRWTYEEKTYWKSDTIRGFSMFLSNENPSHKTALEFAKSIAASWIAVGHRPTLHHAAKIKGENRPLVSPKFGIYDVPFAVIRRTTVPALLLEVGVLINPEEEAWLSTAATRKKLQSALIESLEGHVCKTD